MKILPLVIVGNGNVGRSLVGQLAAARPRLAPRGLDLRVVGLARRKTGAFVQDGFSDETLSALADGKAHVETLPSACPHEGLAELTERMRASGFKEQVIVDATAEASEDAHAEWLRSGWHVVTANKKPLTASMEAYDAIMAASSGGARYRYEATCGAGLPIIGTLADLLASGDELYEVQGAASGTLGFICSTCEGGAGFAETVAEAKAKGYTEPDPRDDLAGTDVARKALILARLAGWRMELADIPTESLALDGYGPLDERFRSAAARGKTLRYLMSVRTTGVRVGLEEVERGPGFGGLRGPENMFVIRTKRYDAAPLVVRGPGAGAEVTAAGIFSDILRIAGF